MSTKHFNRPTSSYTGEVGLTNRTKYQDDSAASPRVPISSQKMDGDLNYLLDAVNTLYDTAVNSAIPDDSITDAKLRNSAGLSVIGRSANTTGNPADIIAASDGEVLRRSGTSIGFGQITTGGIVDSAVTAVKIADTNVTYAKIQNVPTGTILGRSTAGAGSLEELTLGSGLSLASGVLSGVPVFNNQQVFTANGTFTPAANVTRVYVEVWGAGGGGGGAVSANGGTGAGGGAGGYSAGFVTVTPSVGVTVTVGTGGAAGTSAGGAGGTGGNSSFAGATTPTANGGAGGAGWTATNTSYSGGAGGTASGGTLNFTGQRGQASTLNSAVTVFGGGNGGSAPRGGMGGQTTTTSFTASTGDNGLSPGGGASGGVSTAGNARAGGVGGGGLVIVYYP